ncbi:hypothetical protein [Nostoc sp. FACHB-280]|nr:hypothetical protein [Nostoc sp. FACHB-280]
MLVFTSEIKSIDFSRWRSPVSLLLTDTLKIHKQGIIYSNHT